MSLDYESFFRGLNDAGVEYVLVGGLAVNFHGVPRMTYDIDIVARPERQNLLRLIGKLDQWGYRPRLLLPPRDLADEEKRSSWVREKNLKAFTFWSDKEPLGEVDVLIDLPMPYKELKEGAVRFDVAGIGVWVICLEHLIRMKRAAGRPQDLCDVDHLQSISKL